MHPGEKNFWLQQIMFFLKKKYYIKHLLSDKVSKYGYGEDQLFFLKCLKMEK